MDIMNMLLHDEVFGDVAGMPNASGHRGGFVPVPSVAAATPNDRTNLEQPAAIHLCSLVNCGVRDCGGVDVPGSQQAANDENTRLVLKQQNRAKQARYREKLKVCRVVML